MCGPSACPPLHCFLLCSPPCLLKVSQEILACYLRFLKQAWGRVKTAEMPERKFRGCKAHNHDRMYTQQPLHSITQRATHGEDIVVLVPHLVRFSICFYIYYPHYASIPTYFRIAAAFFYATGQWHFSGRTAAPSFTSTRLYSVPLH